VQFQTDLTKNAYLRVHTCTGCDVGVALLKQTIVAPSISLAHNASRLMLNYIVRHSFR